MKSSYIEEVQAGFRRVATKGTAAGQLASASYKPAAKQEQPNHFTTDRINQKQEQTLIIRRLWLMHQLTILRLLFLS